MNQLNQHNSIDLWRRREEVGEGGEEEIDEGEGGSGGKDGRR